MGFPLTFARILFVLLCCITHILASTGDRSYVFYTCNTNCLNHICNTSTDSAHVNWTDYFPGRSFPEEAVLWNCERECKYRCMWKTVEAFRQDNLPVPQFYGKWPFVRMFGVQEPASTLFSLLNMLAQISAVSRLCSEFTFRLPMLAFWCMQYAFSIVSWLWSTVFHACDTTLTEALDYFGALAFILASIVTLQARAITAYKMVRQASMLFLIAFFVNHVRYMMWVNFDYGYNMLVAVCFGLVNCFGWLLWSVFLCSKEKQPYIAYCRQSIFYLLTTMALELCDFHPIWWIFDAHAIWHASSLLIVLPWYKFVAADCHYQLSPKKTS